MKKIWKENAKLILIVTIAIVLTSGATYAATTMYNSNIVGYDNTTSGLNSTNVQSALDEVYSAASNYAAYNTRLEDVEDLIRANAGFHNSIFRGEDVSKYMPSSVVSGGDGSIYDRIAGTNGYSLFEDLYVGDYIVADKVNATVNGIVWRIAGFDILEMVGGSTILTSHHVAIVPDEVLGSSYMNSSNTTSGGYVGSYMYTTTLPSVLTTYINPVFSGHVLSYDAVLTTEVGTNLYNRYGQNLGASSSAGWYTRQLDLMNEVQVSGTIIWSSSGYDVGNDPIQFPLFRLRPGLKTAYNSTIHSTSTRCSYWLRSVTAAHWFAAVISTGNLFDSSASNSHGVRPYFYIG